MKEVYIIWERHPSVCDTFPSIENPRKLISVHITMEGAIKAEGLLVRKPDIYYSIEIRAMKE